MIHVVFPIVKREKTLEFEIKKNFNEKNCCIIIEKKIWQKKNLYLLKRNMSPQG